MLNRLLRFRHKSNLLITPAQDKNTMQSTLLKCFLALTLLPVFVSNTFAQDTICINNTIEHRIKSRYLDEERTYWVSLPLRYAEEESYPVIYVFDAEWRFDLIRNIVFDMGANKKIQKSIIIGVPHVEWEYQRGIDLTFSQSRVEYDGEAVDSTWYNDKNSGGGMQFYQYLTAELMADVNRNYSTNGHETLVGHSYGGYFGGYILSLDHPFEVIHIFDPSMWYSNGEVIDRFKAKPYEKQTTIHLTYQPVPAFHKEKIEAFIEALNKNEHIRLTTQFYPEETNNALHLDSFYQGVLKTHPR